MRSKPHEKRAVPRKGGFLVAIEPRCREVVHLSEKLGSELGGETPLESAEVTRSIDIRKLPQKIPVQMLPNNVRCLGILHSGGHDCRSDGR